VWKKPGQLKDASARNATALCGCRPFPGIARQRGLVQDAPSGRFARADLVGHLPTFHRQMTGARVVDPSHASFTGLFSHPRSAGLSEELCENIGVSPASAEVHEADVIGGALTAEPRGFGLREGTPMTGLDGWQCRHALAGQGGAAV
jgi:sugar (pentulose or hexulose) kinase